jgi:hypothetical protein
MDFLNNSYSVLYFIYKILNIISKKVKKFFIKININSINIISI